MSKQLLNSLEIKGFRGYKQLTIDRLRRINLIVGPNGVGKTSLLEAIQLLVEKGSPALIVELLNKRNEGIEIRRLNRASTFDDDEAVKNIKIIAEGLGNLFYGRPDIDTEFSQYQFTISDPTDTDKLLKVKSSWFEEVEVEEQTTVDGRSLVKRRTALIDVLEGNDAPPEGDVQLGLTIQSGAQKRNYQLETYFRSIRFAPNSSKSSLNVITVQGLDEALLSAYWSNIVLTDYEPDILAAVRIISPDIEDFAFRDDERGRNKYPIVRLKDLAKPVPFHSLGEGAVRILGIILALVNSRDGVLLIDEIDTGLHHSVQIKMWEFVFKLSEQLKVQLFATTHSQDCLSAFEYVANQHAGLGQLISLGAWQEFVGSTGIQGVYPYTGVR
jgi:ABC-type branched-subunit amino acid transport system ATPase component